MSVNDDWVSIQVEFVIDLVVQIRRAICDIEVTDRILSTNWSIGEGFGVADGRAKGVESIVELVEWMLPPDPGEGAWFVGAEPNAWRVTKSHDASLPHYPQSRHQSR
jgi:hypothetical protein